MILLKVVEILRDISDSSITNDPVKIAVGIVLLMVILVVHIALVLNHIRITKPNSWDIFKSLHEIRDTKNGD
jgi:hypothetical protein